MRAELAEWELLAPAIEVYSGAKSTVAFRLRLKRKWQWFGLNHMSVIGLITTTVHTYAYVHMHTRTCALMHECGVEVFYVFTIPPSAAADRASVTFTLILTVVAAKLVLADSLPKISYLTELDRFLLSCFGLIMVAPTRACMHYDM